MKQSVKILKKWGCLGPTELVLLISLPFGVWMFMRYSYEVGNGKALRIVDANTVVIQNDKGKEDTVHLAGIECSGKGPARWDLRSGAVSKVDCRKRGAGWMRKSNRRQG